MKECWKDTKWLQEKAKANNEKKIHGRRSKKREINENLASGRSSVEYSGLQGNTKTIARKGLLFEPHLPSAISIGAQPIVALSLS